MVANAVYAERSPGAPLCFEVAGKGPRQNYKTHVFQVCAITDAFVMGMRRHVWTAHLFNTSQGAFAGIREMIAVIADKNAEASIGLHARLGFTEVGRMGRVGFKFGRWLGTVTMQKSLKKRRKG